MIKVNIILCLNIFLLLTEVDSYGYRIDNKVINESNWSFIENNVQEASNNALNGKPLILQHPDAKFFCHTSGAQVYCSPGKINFVFTKIKSEQKISEASGEAAELSNEKEKLEFRNNLTNQSTNEIAQIDLILINSNLKALIKPYDEQNYHESIYSMYTSKRGISNIHTYKTISYKNIYPHIDLLLHCIEGGIKYEFIVHSDGNVHQIKLKWTGLKSIDQLENGGISYSFDFGKMTDSRPVCFQNGKRINCRFEKFGTCVGFKIAPFDHEKDLVIDPTLTWGTFYGSNGVDIANAIITDRLGYVYITGNTTSISGITTVGAYQVSFKGIATSGYGDAFLAKFDKNGNILWATYFGGNSGTDARSIAVDPYSNNDIIISGVTSSSDLSSKNTYHGGTDAFIAKFDENGILKWSTYYGGNQLDYSYGVAIDIHSDIYISGRTLSKTDIATKGAYNISLNGASNYSGDAFLAKFDINGNILWGTYYGGDADDIAYKVVADMNNNVYITGITNSNSNIASKGAYQTSYAGNSDAFIAKFDENGNYKWGTYFGGGSLDNSVGICCDNYGNLYITGSTQSSSRIATSNAYQTELKGNSDAFLAKFKENGNLIWASYYGGEGDDGSGSMCLDNTGTIFLSGFTTSDSSIATSGAFRTRLKGFENVFISRFDENGKFLWASYYGAGSLNYSTGISADLNNNVYITGRTTSDSIDIATSGAFQTINKGGSDAFIAKFNFLPYYDIGISKLLSPKIRTCQDSIPILLQIKNFGLKTINSFKVGCYLNGSIQTPISWQGTLNSQDSIVLYIGLHLLIPGSNTVKIWVSSLNNLIDSFPINDTISVFITRDILPSASAGPDTTLCFNQTYTMQGAGGITYKWTPAKFLSNDTIPNPKAVLPNTQLYNLKVSNQQGCSDSAQVLIKVRPRLRVSVSSDRDTICLGEPVILSASPHGGDSSNYIFTWPSDSFTGNPLVINPKVSGWHNVILSDNCTPLSAEDSIYITVTPKPKASFIWRPKQYIIQKRPVYFKNTSQNASSYLWIFGSKNDSTKISSPTYIYTDTGNYKVILIAYGNNGCINDTAIGYIKVIDGTVAIYIPNIFTPNGDGNNDFFGISGTGIKTCSLTIYNRWGELVYFQSSTAQRSPAPVPITSGGDLGVGVWDGTFKGAPAPEGVYIYMITATDIFDEKHYLKGNVTLNR